MRILFLTQVLPYPLDAGPKVRAYFVLRYLAHRHDVTLVSFSRAADTDDAVDHLAGFCSRVHTVPMVRGKLKDLQYLANSVVTRQPFLIVRDRMQEMSERLAATVKKEGPFDVIHSDQLWMAQYALDVKRRSVDGGPPKTLLDQHNAVFMIAQRLAESEPSSLKRKLLLLESQKMAKYEAVVCSQFDFVVWVTQEDRAAVQLQFDRNRGDGMPLGTVIPICTDPVSQPVVRRGPNPRRVTFVGGLHYPPNARGILWFAEEIFPSILERVPDAVLTVIGKDPPRELKGQGIDGRNLEITGYVADITPYLEETGAFIVPLRAGGGMRVKILDAWTWGLPVVSTTVGAEGIETHPGKDILLADDPHRFSDSVVSLLQNAGFSEYVARNGRQSALEKYCWRTQYVAWDKAYHR